MLCYRVQTQVGANAVASTAAVTTTILPTW